jgi:hypothetical protein
MNMKEHITNVQRTIELLANVVEYSPEEGTLVWVEPPSKFHSYMVGKNAFSLQSRGTKLFPLFKLISKYKNQRVSTKSLIYYIMEGEHIPYGKLVLQSLDGDVTNIKWDNICPMDKHTSAKDAYEKHNIKTGGRVNTTGKIGVSWDKDRGKYVATIRVNYKQIYLGRFEYLEDAIAKRVQAEEEYGYAPKWRD